MTISERIFLLFDKNKDKKQSELARLLGVRQNTITNWKQNLNNPAAEHLEKIADFFGVSVEYLVTGKEEQSKPTIFFGRGAGLITPASTNVIIIENGSKHEYTLNQKDLEIVKSLSDRLSK